MNAGREDTRRFSSDNKSNARNNYNASSGKKVGSGLDEKEQFGVKISFIWSSARWFTVVEFTVTSYYCTTL